MWKWIKIQQALLNISFDHIVDISDRQSYFFSQQQNMFMVFVSISYQKVVLNESLTKFKSSLQFRDLGKKTQTNI